MKRARTTLRRLRGSLSGLAAVEFGLSLPLLLVASLYGVETSNLALTHMKVSKVALHIADNAARVGDTSTLTNRKIFEADVTDLLVGANTQAGTGLELYKRGRVIVSSVEVFDAAVSCKFFPCPSIFNGMKFIGWQRCMGKKKTFGSYGLQFFPVPNGIGPSGEEVSPDPGTSVIFVEVAYDYKPMISKHFVGSPTIKAIASFTQRDNVDLGGLWPFKKGTGEFVADCWKFTDGPI